MFYIGYTSYIPRERTYKMARCRKWITWSILVLFLSCLVTGSQAEDNPDDKASSSVNDGGQKTGSSALEKGMRPFYSMTQTFLNLVIKEDFISSNPELMDILLNNSNNGNSMDSSLENYLLNNWKSLLTVNAGFTACIIVGILFIILLPIVGFFFCCCRMCGQCGGKVHPQEGRHHKCRQYTCGTILFLCNTIMLVGLVFAFMTNEQLRLGTAPNGGYISRASGRVQSFNRYLDQINRDLTSANATFVDGDNRVIRRILDIGREAADVVDQNTNVTTLLEDATALADAMGEIEVLLDSVQDSKSEIVTALSKLEDNLVTWKDNTKSVLQQCSTAQCNDLYQEVNSININVDYEQANLEIQTQIDKLQNVGEIRQYINSSRDRYLEKYETIDLLVEAEIKDIEDEKNVIIADTSQRLSTIKNNITQFREFIKDKVIKEIDSYNSQAESYGTYGWYVGISLCCVYLLIILCYFLGLMFGVCGDPPYEDSNACNKGVGANLLLAGVGFCFLFGWLLMLVCTPLYIVGQLAHSQVCRPLTPNLSDSVYLEILDRYAVDLLSEEPLLQGIVPSAIIAGCEENEGIYTALQLSKIYNIDDINIDDYDVRDKLDALEDAGIAVNFNNVKIIDNDIRTELDNIRNSKLDDLPLTAYITELDKITLSPSLEDVQDDLENQRDAFRDGGDTDKANQMDMVISNLDVVKNELNIVQTKMPVIGGELRTAVDSLQNKISAQTGGMTIKKRAGKLKDDLEAAQDNLEDNGKDILTQFFAQASDSLYDDIKGVVEELKTEIKEDVGKCRPAYDALQGLVNVACVDFLNPYNGFWFSFGWILAFFIPAIISAVHLAGSYRKTEEYDPHDNKSFDEPTYGYSTATGYYSRVPTSPY